MNKQKIAMLVQLKVWGMNEKNILTGSQGEELVFSWQGFGRTVEAIGQFYKSKWEEADYIQSTTQAETFFVSIFMQSDRDMADQFGVIIACHLAALEAKGVDRKA